MSDDLISRQAAIDATELLIKDLRKDTVDVMNFGHNYNHGVADAIATLKHLPFALPEIIRCKDCKYRDDDDFCTGRGFPNVLTPDDGFCDKGERRASEND